MLDSNSYVLASRMQMDALECSCTLVWPMKAEKVKIIKTLRRATPFVAGQQQMVPWKMSFGFVLRRLTMCAVKFTVLHTFLCNLKIKWAIEDGYGTFTELDWVVRSGGNAFRKTHGGRSLWEILKASRVENSRTLDLH